MKKLLTVFGLVLLSIAPADAGRRWWAPVFINPNGFAYGALGTVRNSADQVQDIGCTAGRGNGSWFGSCYATDANGVQAYCFFYDAGLAQIASGITGDSHIMFEWDSIGECLTIQVDHDSGYDPKNP